MYLYLFWYLLFLPPFDQHHRPVMKREVKLRNVPRGNFSWKNSRTFILKNDKVVYNYFFGNLKFLLNHGFPRPIFPKKIGLGNPCKIPWTSLWMFFIFKFIFINILKLFLHIIGLICCLFIIVLICLFSLVFSNRCIQNYVHLSSRYMIPTLFNRDVLGLCWLHHSQLKFF